MDAQKSALAELLGKSPASALAVRSDLLILRDTVFVREALSELILRDVYSAPVCSSTGAVTGLIDLRTLLTSWIAAMGGAEAALALSADESILRFELFLASPLLPLIVPLDGLPHLRSSTASLLDAARLFVQHAAQRVVLLDDGMYSLLFFFQYLFF